MKTIKNHAASILLGIGTLLALGFQALGAYLILIGIIMLYQKHKALL